MATRRPLVLNNGLVSELLDGDTVTAGTSTTQVVAGSGLTGGGSVSTNPQLDLALAPNPSGIIYVGDALGIDGAAGVLADIALASGTAAASLASDALASGNNSLVVGTAALASGNAALALVPTLGGGGGGTVVELTAASAIASGYAVGVDDAGKVQSVRSLITDNSNPMVFNTYSTVAAGSANETDSQYVTSDNSVVVSYKFTTGSVNGYLTVVTNTGTTINASSSYTYASSVYAPKIVYDSFNNKVVVVYDNLTTNTAIVATLTGTVVSFGSGVTVYAANRFDMLSTTFDSTNNKVIICGRNRTNSYYGTGVVGTVSGTSISFGTPVVFSSSTRSNPIDVVFDPSTNTFVVFIYDTGLTQSRAYRGNVSGTSLTFNPSAPIFENAAVNEGQAVFDDLNNVVVLVYRDAGNSDYGTAIVGSYSGGSTSFGTPVVFTSVSISQIGATFDTKNKKVIATYNQAGSQYSIVGSVSGTSIVFNTAGLIQAVSTSFNSLTYNPIADRVFSLRTYSSNLEAAVADPLSVINYNPTVNSYPNVLGISQSTVASGSPCLVSLPGTLYNEPAANLTTGAFYYANPTTSGITTTSIKPTSWDGQVPWNYIGRAVTSSGLMLLKSI